MTMVPPARALARGLHPDYNDADMGGKIHDLVIVGSGFGGSVCALRAAQAGLHVVVLERGERQSPQLFEEMAEGRRPFLRTGDRPGLIELHRCKGLAALTASAVGGGSHIYTAVTIPAPPEIFDDRWPRELCFPGMERFYDRVRTVIAPSRIPCDLTRTQMLANAADRLHTEAVRLPLAMDWPLDASELRAPPPDMDSRSQLAKWLQGGHASRKRTLDKTYLRLAEQHGADIRAGHEVRAIEHMPDGYRVHIRRHDNGYWTDESLSARRVILAAGTINSVRLLLQCRDEFATLPDVSPTLGKGFFTNGDLGALLMGPRGDVLPDSGPPVTAWLDLWKSDRLFLMETGLLPALPAPLTMAARTMFGRNVKGSKRENILAPPNARGVQRAIWSFGVMGFDDCPGRLIREFDGELQLLRTPGGHAYIRRAHDKLQDLASAVGATLIPIPEAVLKSCSITVHPLGGARMADSPDHGVTNSFGEVFGCPGLFIADGSLLPTPTGVAPSMTIAAVAEHVIETMLKKC